MTDFYIDPWAGSNDNSGDSWAVDLSGSDGQTYGTGDTRFTSASGGLTGMAGRFIRIVSTIKQIVSVDSATQVQLDSGYTAGSSRSFVIGGPVAAYGSLPVAAYWQPGDRCKYPKTPDCDATEAGSLTWTDGSPAVTMAANRIRRVDDCEAAWTGAADVTATLETNAAYVTQASGCAKIAIATAFGSGKVAYKTIDSNGGLDFSAYQGLSFMFRAGAATVNPAHGWRLCLCSDETGDDIVDDLAFPSQGIYNSGCQPLVLQKGSALGSAIKSVALYVTSDPGAHTIYIDDIVAVKPVADANHVCHTCLLSQGDHLTDDLWWGILCFADETTITLSGSIEGDTGAVNPSYRREIVSVPLHTYPLPTGVVGTPLQPVEVSGGWNKSTDLQDGVTAFFLLPSTSAASYIWTIGSNNHYIKWKNFILGLPFSKGITPGSNQQGLMFEDVLFVGMMKANGNIALDLCGSTTAAHTYDNYRFVRVRFTGLGGSYYALSARPSFSSHYQAALNWYLEDVRFVSTRGLEAGQWLNFRVKDLAIVNSVGTVSGFIVYDAPNDWDVDGLVLKGNNLYGMTFQNGGFKIRIRDLVASGNSSGTMQVRHSDSRLFNPLNSDTVKYDAILSGGRVACIKDGGVANSHIIYDYAGSIASEDTVRHTASDISWKLSPTVESGVLRLKVAELAVAAGTYTAGIWMRRTDVGITGKFYVPGGQIAGVGDEIAEFIGANAHIWELQSIEFTATESGALEFFVEVAGGSEYSLYIDDFSLAS